jgi:hypothetical protein
MKDIALAKNSGTLDFLDFNILAFLLDSNILANISEFANNKSRLKPSIYGNYFVTCLFDW